jgi:PKHD-type hydroxylase
MKKRNNEIKSSVWPFYIDNVQTWSFWNSCFSPKECKTIIDIGNKQGLIKGKTFLKNSQKIRNSNISWLYPSKDLEWVYRRLTDVILELNNKFFKFEIYGFIEGLQFTHYKEPNGKYQKHVDRSVNTRIRKLSLSVQLSDPNSYEGGELILNEGNEIVIPKEQGNLILFPSFVLHEVKPVTKGERFSLVAWITGPNFK